MRFTIDRSELRDGTSIQKGSKERMSYLGHEAMGRRPVAITPVIDDNGRLVSAILLTDDPYDPDGKGVTLTITFRPVWCKIFRLCSMKRDHLSAIVLETDDGKKYWIDGNDVKECSFTTEGPGTDPEIIHKSQEVLGDMLADGHVSDILHNAIKFINKRF